MRKIIVCIAAMACAANMWAQVTEGPWTQLGYKSHNCANDGSTTSITYAGMSDHGWNGYYTPWHDGDGVGCTFEGSSPDTSLLGIFSVYEKGIEIQSYSSVDVEWEYQLRSKSTKHHSATCLYFLEGARNDITHLAVDFSNHHDTETGAEYLLDSLVNRAQDGEVKTGSEKTIHFGFDNRLGSTDQTKTWYLMLTHVVGSAKGTDGLKEWGSFKSVRVKTTQTYYKIFTFNANAEDATGTMEQAVVADVGKLPHNKFVRAGYAFLGWATTPDGEKVYGDEAEVTATAVDKGSVPLYAVWSQGPVVEGPWTLLEMNSQKCGRNDTMSIAYNLLDSTHWGTLRFWDDIDGIGWTVEGSSEDNSTNGVFYICYLHDTLPPYTRRQLTWTYKLLSKTEKHYSDVALYARDDLKKLKAMRVDFTQNHTNHAGENYMLSRFHNDDYEKQATDNETHTFDFDNHRGYNPSVKSWYLMLTHVASTEDAKSNLHEWGSFIHIDATWDTLYYRYVTYNANGGSGSMSMQEIERSSNLTANTFTRKGYTFRGWATNPIGDAVYADEAEVTATAEDKGPLALYARWESNTEVPEIFQYGYDCERDPAYPKKDNDARLYNISNPLLGLQGIGATTNVPAGPWKLERIEMYDADHISIYSDSEDGVREQARTVLGEYYGYSHVPDYATDTTAFDAFAHDHLPVYRLFQWNAEKAAYQGVAYGYSFAFANQDNAKGKAVLFREAGSAIGCLLIDTAQSTEPQGEVHIMFDDDLTYFIPSSSMTLKPTGIQGLAYTGSAQPLVTAGEAQHGTMVYKIDGGEWSADLPAATELGTYTVSYKVAGDAAYLDYIPDGNTIEVTIVKGIPTYIPRLSAIPHLIYNGSPMPLVEEVHSDGGTVWYKNGVDGEWSTEVPQADAVGHYTVYHKIIGDANHTDREPELVIASIFASDSRDIPQHQNYTGSSMLACQTGADTEFSADRLFSDSRNKYETKWCSKANGITRYEDRPKDMVVWKTSEPVKVVSYTLITALDTKQFPNRNWYSWTLYGGRFITDDEARNALLTEEGWTIVDNQIKDSVLKAVNNTEFQFACSNPGVYQYYRLVIHALHVIDSAQNQGIQQMDELILGVANITPPAYTRKPVAVPYLNYNGAKQALVEPGVTTYGTIQYKVEDGEWIDTVPQVAAVGNYRVYYKIQESERYPETGYGMVITSIYGDRTIPQPYYEYLDWEMKIDELVWQQGENTSEDQSANKLLNRGWEYWDQKWCSKTDGVKKYADRPKDMLVWKTAEPVLMESYRLVTAWDTKDTLNRNWYSWTIYGGRFANDDEARAAFKQEDAWTIIDNQNRDTLLKEENNQVCHYVCNTPDVYQYYRLVIHELHVTDSSYEDQSTQQMGELVMCITPAPEYTQQPAARPNLQYTGAKQALIEPGITTYNTLLYKLDNGEWTDTVPKATAAGNYRVYYKIQGSELYPETGHGMVIASIYDHPTIPEHEDYAADKTSVLASQQGANTGSDKAEKMFDGNRDTKWCSFTNDINAYSDRPKDIVVWKTAESVTMVSYTLTTGSDTQDYPNRNWSSWTLYGGDFDSDKAARNALLTEEAWTIIDNQIQDTVLKAFNDSCFQFACNNPGAYKYYRLVIHDIKFVQGGEQDNIQQMAELTMGIDPSTPTGIDNGQWTKDNGHWRKVLRDGQLFILRDGKTYNAQGVLVESRK